MMEAYRLFLYCAMTIYVAYEFYCVLSLDKPVITQVEQDRRFIRMLGLTMVYSVFLVISFFS